MSRVSILLDDRRIRDNSPKETMIWCAGIRPPGRHAIRRLMLVRTGMIGDWRGYGVLVEVSIRIGPRW